MSPETVERLNPDTRKSLHAMAWMDAQLRPSRLPVVPPAQSGASASDLRMRMDVARWRDWLEAAIFPPDEPVT